MSSYLDTRDLDEELDDLLERDLKELGDADQQQLAPLDEDERERLSALIALRNEIGSEWAHGVTLIPASEFEEYAEDLAYDVGFVARDSQISSYVDWTRWADDVKVDYLSCDLDGETYYYRS